MIKVEENLFLYDGVYVRKLDNGRYIARFYVNSVKSICTVSASTEEGFKKVFNKFVRTNKGLDIKRYQRSLLMR